MSNSQIGFEQFMNMRSAIMPQFSPDGKRVAFLTDITGAYQLWSLDVQGGWPHQLTFFKEPLSGIWYSPNADRLLFGMDVGGNERVQFSLLSGNGEELTELTSSPTTIHQFGGWSPDGTQIAFSANKRHAAFFDIYTMNVETKEERLVFQHDGMNDVEGWTPDGQKLILGRNNTDLPNDNNLFLLDLKTGAIQANIKAMAQESKYEVKTPFSACSLRDAEYHIKADGTITIMRGSATVIYRDKNGTSHTRSVNAGETFQMPDAPSAPKTTQP